MSRTDNERVRTLMTELAAKQPALHQALSQTILRLVKHRPHDPLTCFEQYAIAAASATSAASSTAPLMHQPSSLTDAQKSKLLAYLDRTELLYKKPKKAGSTAGGEGGEGGDAAAAEEEEEEEEEAEIPAILPDFAALSHLYREAGIAFTSLELAQLEKGVIGLLRQHANAESVRFWGKVHTLTRDYYVLEMKKSEYEEAEADAEAGGGDDAGDGEAKVDDRREAMGTGANEYLYFATQTPADVASWKALPPVVPEQIIVARKCHRFLTGDLNATVRGFPRFPGNEAALLRAQIARITHGTTLCPVGAYVLDEQEGVAIADESFAGVRARQLRERKNWLHVRSHLLREGRTEPWEDEEGGDEEEEDEEAKAARLAEKEKNKEDKVPALRSIDDDAVPALRRRGGPWSIRLSTEQDTGFRPVWQAPKAAAPGGEEEEEKKAEKDDTHVVLAMQSNLWPGAYSIAKGKTWLSVYVGWALKHHNQSAPYRPSGPAPFQREYSAKPIVEQDDVQPNAEEQQREQEEAEEKKREEERKREAGELEEEEEDDGVVLEDVAKPADEE